MCKKIMVLIYNVIKNFFKKILVYFINLFIFASSFQKCAQKVNDKKK